MNARDTIADALHRKCVKPGCSTATDWDYEDADAVIAAVRAMPVEDQAELIEGQVQHDRAMRTARIIGLWKEATR